MDPRDRCVERARKRLRHQKKWGKWWPALSYGIGGICRIGHLLNPIHFEDRAQRPSSFEIGLVIGLLFGFIAAGAFVHAALHLAELIKWLRGDVADELLVEYHDGLTELLKNQMPREPSSPNVSEPVRPPATDQPGR